ncbi:hypothetical protein KTE19_11505 [Lentilactobacillus sp. IMAU92037]|uniref:hypothetical protein n=1 Tax=Lentilactobacillus TaxID=2767893 RepID=UPI001C27B513|nr:MULTISPECIES: hypothetical protein [Lentilactobacillus]MBU9788810.1 hypothetical protein [Lentilactobacillus dabitei]MBV0931312.1 hypothetical protein [Lentilactobacillus dabitei]MDM7517392.1 hypothetical protein [Lentilactobacillus sp. TOM.63]
MNQSLTLSLLIAVPLAIGSVSTTTNAKAATWHTGTPTAFQGHWRNKTVNIGKYFGMKKLYSHESVRVKSNRIDASLTQSAGWHLTNTKWRKINSHAYTIKGKNALNELHTGRFTFNKVSGKQVKIYYDGFNIAKGTPFSPYFYRVTKKA